jgi:hypothetical protein
VPLRSALRRAASNNPAPLTVRPQHPVLAFAGVRLTPALARHRRLRRASPTATHFHVPAFDRFDEILYLVENSSDLTLTDSARCHIRVAIKNARTVT